jgi:hypothetical protein
MSVADLRQKAARFSFCYNQRIISFLLWHKWKNICNQLIIVGNVSPQQWGTKHELDIIIPAEGGDDNIKTIPLYYFKRLLKDRFAARFADTLKRKFTRHGGCRQPAGKIGPLPRHIQIFDTGDFSVKAIQLCVRRH